MSCSVWPAVWMSNERKEAHPPHIGEGKGNFFVILLEKRLPASAYSLKKVMKSALFSAGFIHFMRALTFLNKQHKRRSSCECAATCFSSLGRRRRSNSCSFIRWMWWIKQLAVCDQTTAGACCWKEAHAGLRGSMAVKFFKRQRIPQVAFLF